LGSEQLNMGPDTFGAGSCAAEMHRGERLRMPLIVDRHAWLTSLAARAGGEVAHIGCADSPYTAALLAAGALLHLRLVQVASVTGLDVDVEGMRLLADALPAQRLLVGDLTYGVPDDERGRYALVIAGEVLEHVPDADTFLRGCAALLAPGGALCVTVPNACCPKVGLRALVGRESVHPDHRVYYGPRTLQRTLEGAGLEVESMASCFPPGAGVIGQRLVNPLLVLFHRAFEGPVGDGLIAVARARSNASTIAS
jgi:2-polyprenyl-3-methyl-5-hydroxy-6-metoxy-1,4-benzoquinol methylase